jgi:hypothetical protein
MSHPTLNRTWHFLKEKGFLLPINLAIALLLIWLVFPFFKYRSWQPVVFGRYSVRFLIFLVAITAAITVYAFLAIIGSKRINRTLLLCLFVFFLLAEATTRIFISSPRLNERQVTELKPYVEFGNKPKTVFAAHQLLYIPPEQAQNAHETINEIGFRGPVPSRSKAGEYRIILIGGSAAFAGFPLSNSIAGQLESLFHKDGRTDVKVYNWGVQAYVSGQELSLLTHTILDYQPDLVIVYDGANDIYFPYFGDPRPDNPVLFMEREAEGNHGSPRLPSAGYLLGKSKFLTWALTLVPNNRLNSPTDVSLINSLRQQTAYGGESWKESIVESYVANHKRMCSVANGGHFKLLTVVQPTLAFKNPWIGKELSVWQPSSELLQYFRDQYSRIRRRLPETSPYPNCYSFDLGSTFSDYHQQVFVDVFHITNVGNTWIANQIYADLNTRGIVKLEPSGKD